MGSLVGALYVILAFRTIEPSALRCAPPGPAARCRIDARRQIVSRARAMGSSQSGDYSIPVGTDPSSIAASQLCAIGYLPRIASIRLSAFSAAACTVIPSRITSASAVPQICWESASA